MAEQATDIIGWINNHGRVRVIFDESQAELNNGRVLTYIVANLTRWTTHFLSFSRLLELKASLRDAAAYKIREIVAAQVGAEKNARAAKLEGIAKGYCRLLDDEEFWEALQEVVDDIEPICYATNINQSDTVRPDQVVLTFAAIFRHFNDHNDPIIANGMRKRIEKRWKALDQPMFIAALVLNPYERTERFGEQANANVFTLNTLITNVSITSSL